ncbi:MAG: hypothetical protein DRJ09_05160 [Bacteroidetes bacterium]|nr:MAG: hypothetical protein DRJ09_05160 [Bacteroidota bacterium]
MENKKFNNRLLTGIALLIFGALLFARNFGLINPEILEYLFHWQSILIIIGIFVLARKPHKLTGYILIFIGVIFFIPVLFGISVQLIIWPVMLIGVGTMILFRGFFNHHFPHRKHAFAHYAEKDIEIKISQRED